MLHLRQLVFVLLVYLNIFDCYKILIVLPTPFKSHWNVGSSIAKALAEKEHKVTLISPYELTHRNVKNILTKREKIGLS